MEEKKRKEKNYSPFALLTSVKDSENVKNWALVDEI